MTVIRLSTALMLLAVVGMMVMASASNMMTLYLGLELQSLALYVMAAFARDDVRQAMVKEGVDAAAARGTSARNTAASRSAEPLSTRMTGARCAAAGSWWSGASCPIRRRSAARWTR